MRGIKLIVAVAVTMLATSATASAACDLTISSGPTSGITESPVGTYTSSADSAVLNVSTLNARLATGNANVNVGTVPCLQSGNITISDTVSWTTANSLTMFGTGDVAIQAPITATSGSAAFSLQTSQGVSQTAAGPISVGGPTTVNLGFGAADLNDAANNFGSLAVVAAPNGVAVSDTNAIVLAGVNTNSVLLLSAASVSQTAALAVGGPTQISSPGTIQLNAANTFTGSVNIPVGGSTTLNATGNLSLGQIAVGTLDVTAGGTLAGDFPVTAGQTTLAAPTAITFAEFGNNFTGPVSINTNGVATLRDANNLTLGTVASNGADIFSEGAMTQTGAISDGGQFEVQGDGGLTLTNPANDFDDVGFESDGGSVAVRDANSVSLRAVDVSGSGTATVTAGNDLVVPDENTAFTAGAITLVSDANAGSALGPGGIEIAGDRAITSTAAPVGLYTARRDQNSISAAATLNGATFTPGPEFVDSATEVWNTAFPAGAATNPFTIFYKQVNPPPPPVDPPETTLTKTPKKKVKTKKKKVKVGFEFSSTVVGSTFTCTLDGKAAACSSPFKAKVKKGKHSFSVAASAAGKTDASPAQFSFKVKRKPKRH